jgi:two-component system NarL family response regulator
MQPLAKPGSDSRINVGVVHADSIVSAGVIALLGGLADMRVRALGIGEIAASASQVIVIDACTAVDYMSIRPAGDLTRYPGLLVIAQIGREWDVREALAMGLHGYLLQNCAPEQLAAAVRAVGCGRNYMCSELGHVRESVGIGLTPRETDVLRLMAQGHCNKMIARDLGIGVGTVKTHIKGLFEKLGVSARTQAVVVASRCGLVNGIKPAQPLRDWSRLAA